VNTAQLRSFFLGLCLASAIASLVVEHAAAQQTDRPAKTKTPKKPRRLNPLRGDQPATPTPQPIADDSPGTANAPGTEPAIPGQNIKPFETGIDYQPTSPNTRVTFNLEDADLPELVRLMSQITGRSFILPSKSRSIKATVYAPTKVTAAEAYQAFLSILELNGMAIVPSGRYMKIVESGRVEGRAVPLFSGDEAVPVGDRFVTRLQAVKNISAEDASKLLERFKSGDGGLTAYAPTNMLIMTDTGTNIRRMLRILEEVDIARTGEQMWIETIHHANATDLEKRLNDIFDVANGGTAGSGGKAKKAPVPGQPAPGSTTIGGGESRLTKVIADERTNSLVIVATEPAYLRVLEMLKYLDVSMEGEGRMHVHHLQHSDAEEIANTLSNLIGKGGQGAKGGGQGQPADAGSGVFEGKVAITAHKASNALVITSSNHDYAALKSVITMLDSQRRQVFIEAVIMELGVNRSSKLGLGYHGGIPDAPTDGAVSVLGFNSKTSVFGLPGMLAAGATGDLLTGLAVGVQGPVIQSSVAGLSIPGFGVALNALASAGDANVLSTPHLIASDNVEAEISVGENVPLQTSSVGGGLGSLAGLAGLGGASGALGGLGGALGGLGGLGGGLGGSVPRDNVGTTVTITPHLNDASEIRLTISEEISAAGAPSESGNLGVRSISRTKAKTEVVVRDQQTVVIGGLMRDQVTTSRSKIPILGDIPVIGALFRTDEKTKNKKNLLLFLTPYIIRSPADLRSIYERKMRERQEFLDRYFVFADSQYEPPVDYSRTRGLLGEIMKELAEQDNERKLAAAAAKKPELGHDPRSPVGLADARNARSGGGENGSSPDAPGPGNPQQLSEGANAPPGSNAPPDGSPAFNAPPPPSAAPEAVPPPNLPPPPLPNQ
jgi:general secretion pathway protein D